MKIAFWGIFGAQNLGNECTLHAMLEAARRYLPAARLVVVGLHTEDVARRHGVEAMLISPHHDLEPSRADRSTKWQRLKIELGDWARIVREMKEIDMLVMTGTGMLVADHDPPFGMPYQMFKWVAAASIRRRRIAFVSVGAEVLRGTLPRRLLGFSLRLASYRSYRDLVSRDRAATLFSGAARDPVYPDLAFSLPKGLLATPPSKPGKGIVAVGIYTLPRCGAVFDQYIEQIGAFMAWLLEQGYTPRIVLGDSAYDRIGHVNVVRWLKSRNLYERVLDEPADSFEQLLLQLGEADLVVATRFHNVLLSAMLCKPVVSISHMDKNDELMKSMGLARYCMPLKGLRVEDIVRLFTDLADNAADVRAILKARAESFRDQLEDQYRALFRVDGAENRASARAASLVPPGGE